MPINGFWGEEKFDGALEIFSDTGKITVFKPLRDFMNNPESLDKNYAWKMHLQQMVLEENPIDYLRKWIV